MENLHHDSVIRPHQSAAHPVQSVINTQADTHKHNTAHIQQKKFQLDAIRHKEVIMSNI